MASKVEELRDKTIEIIKEFSGGGIAGEIIDLIDWTISAAHAEGVAEGAERILRMRLKRKPTTIGEDYTSWSINDLFCELISYCLGNIEDDITEAMEAAILTKARAEGAEQKRLEILKASVGTTPVDITAGTVIHPTANDTLCWRIAYLIPASVLTPKEEPCRVLEYEVSGASIAWQGDSDRWWLCHG